MHLAPINHSRAFRGTNIMTPVVVSYFRGTLGGRVVHVELSKENPPYWSQTVERNPAGCPLWGVSFRRPDGTQLDPDPSFSAHSREEAEERIRSL